MQIRYSIIGSKMLMIDMILTISSWIFPYTGRLVILDLSWIYMHMVNRLFFSNTNLTVSLDSELSYHLWATGV